jgi:hypothetical protein
MRDKRLEEMLSPLCVDDEVRRWFLPPADEVALRIAAVKLSGGGPHQSNALERSRVQHFRAHRVRDMPQILSVGRLRYTP